MRIILFLGTCAVILISVTNISATSPPPLPKPCEVEIHVTGNLQKNGVIDIFVELSNASVAINGNLNIFLSQGLEVVDGTKESNMTVSPAGKSTYEMRAVIREGDRHIIRAAFSASGADIPQYSTATDEAFLDLGAPDQPFKRSVDRQFYKTNDIQMEDGIPVSRTFTPGQDAADKQGLANSYTVTGQVKYRLKDYNNSSFLPVANAKVRVNNFLVVPPEGEPYPAGYVYSEAFTYTDDQGYYSVSWNWQTVQVTVMSENNIAYVNIVDEPDEFPESPCVDNADFTDQVIDIDIEYSEAAHIMRNMRKTLEWSSTYLGFPVDKILAEYYPNTGALAYFDPNQPKIVFYKYYADTGLDEIWNSRGRSVAAHEFGHYIMYRNYSDAFPYYSDPPPVHYYNTVHSLAFAWLEGWAEFVGAATWLTPDTNELTTLGWHTPYMYLECITDQPFDGYYRGTDGTNTNGLLVEGAVATILWDIYDSRAVCQNTYKLEDDEAESKIKTLWDLVRTSRLYNIIGEQYPPQNLYHIYAIWNNFDPGNGEWIWTPYPANYNVDILYNHGLFGYQPNPQRVTGFSIDSCGGDYGPEINLFWYNQLDDVSYFDIYMDDILVESSPNWQHSLSLYNLLPEQEYSFVIKSRWGDFKADPSPTITGQPSGYQPAAPTGLTAEQLTDCSWQLTWADNSSNEEFFKIHAYWVDDEGGARSDWIYADADCTSAHYINVDWGHIIYYDAWALDTLNCGICDFWNPYGCLIFSGMTSTAAVNSQCETYHCPFLFIWNGNKFVPENNLLSASQAVVNIGEDVLDFRHLSAAPAYEENGYSLMIIENAEDLASLDYVSLLAVDIDGCDGEVIADKSGSLYCIVDEIPPKRVVDQSGRDITALVLAEDGENFYAAGPGYLEIEYADLPVNEAFKVTVDDGDVGDGTTIPPKGSNESIEKVSVGDGFITEPYRVDVFVQKLNGEWKRIETIYGQTLCGKPAFVSLGKYISSEGGLRIRYEWNGAYRVDKIAYRYVIRPQSTIVRTIPTLLRHSRLGNVASLLSNADNTYSKLIQGDTLFLEFTCDPPQPDIRREFILVTEGSYIHLPPEKVSQIATNASSLPRAFALDQNYPNPFNPSTVISFDLPEPSHVKITIYNILGQRITTLVNADYSAGTYTIPWDGRDALGKVVSSGVYCYRITTGEFSASKKMVLLK